MRRRFACFASWLRQFVSDATAAVAAVAAARLGPPGPYTFGPPRPAPPPFHPSTVPFHARLLGDSRGRAFSLLVSFLGPHLPFPFPSRPHSLSFLFSRRVYAPTSGDTSRYLDTIVSPERRDRYFDSCVMIDRALRLHDAHSTTSLSFSLTHNQVKYNIYFTGVFSAARIESIMVVEMRFKGQMSR